MEKIQEHQAHACRPLLKTRGFSTLHITIFEMILHGKCNREINDLIGYSQRSHMVVDHSRKVMRKLLAMEGLGINAYHDRIVYPRNYYFWWKKLLDKHLDVLIRQAMLPAFYESCEAKTHNSTEP